MNKQPAIVALLWIIVFFHARDAGWWPLAFIAIYSAIVEIITASGAMWEEAKNKR